MKIVTDIDVDLTSDQYTVQCVYSKLHNTVQIWSNFLIEIPSLGEDLRDLDNNRGSVPKL